MKEINAEIYINWDNDGATVKLSDEEAEKLLALWKEAKTPFSKAWRKKTIGKSSTLGCRRKLPTYMRK